MRGYYGSFDTATCQECGDQFTKKQPGQRYCDIICQIKGNKRQQRTKAKVQR